MTAARVVTLYRSQSLTLGVAESCTGGLLAGTITEIPGSSEVFLGGVVAYSNSLKKSLLNVSNNTLVQYGAVSEPVALEMATGICSLTGATTGLSITGIAGPGSSENKPEGRVCFSLVNNKLNQVITHTVEYGPIGRSKVRNAAIQTALDMIVAEYFK